MRAILLAPVLLTSGLVCGQHLSFDQWTLAAMADIRLLPRYGDREKTIAQKESDASFIQEVLAVDPVPRSASDKLVAHGFSYLGEGEFSKAMYRFNQAWLVDSLNTGAYWGYGQFFLELDRPAVAKQWLNKGLAIDSSDVRLLHLAAIALLAEQHGLRPLNAQAADEMVRNALGLLSRAQSLSPGDASLAYRLSVAHLLLGDCALARHWFKECNGKPGAPIEMGFEGRLDRACPL